MADTTWIVVADDMAIANVAASGLATGLPVKALVFGDMGRAEKAASLGVESVLWFDTNSALAEAYSADVAELADQERPAAILCADEPTARTITGIAAARIGAPAFSSITGVSIDGDKARIDRMIAGGNSVETVEYSGSVAGCLVDGGEEAAQGASVAVQKYEGAPTSAMKVVATNADDGAAASLAAAERVVGVGLGVGPKENLQAVYELAEALGAEIACSLPLCDNYHWFEHSSVVGTSTQKISPRFYIACGVSGVPQHVLGVKGAKTICAINNDPEAPIFKESEYGILGDMNEVLPVLTQAIKAH